MTAARTILVVDAAGGLADLVREAVRSLPEPPEVHSARHLDPVAAANFEVVVAGPGLDTPSGVASLAGLRDAAPATGLVLVFPRRPRVPVRELVRTGAVDLLTCSDALESLGTALQRALNLAAAARPAPAANGGKEKRGRVITVASATGGCGKTFFAVNAAYFLQAHTGLKACVVDLDLQFGEVTAALRLQPRYTIFDAQQHHPGGVDLDEHLDEYIVQHATGISVLPAPKEPSEADRIDPPDVIRIVEAVRRRFDFVIVDTPPALTETVLATLDVSELLYVMATLDLPSVRNLGVFLTTLGKLKVPTDTIRLVMNKAEAGVGIDVDDVGRLFPGGFNAVLPYASVVSRSVNQGAPVLKAFPEAEVSRRLSAALAPLLPEDKRVGCPVVPGARTSILDRLFHRNAHAPALGGAR
jgi:pilus assembly protein CpaE